MAVSKATDLKEYKGLKEFTILVDSLNHKKGAKVALSYEFYVIFKKLKLVK
tara:strand:+ start:753 stop:905 length:153 start_codon:yes stop_codon:yes gene_type:complete